MTQDKETYLGDGLYASFDGWQIRLRAPRDSGDHEIDLEPEVLEKFLVFANRCFEKTESIQKAESDLEGK